MEDYINSIPKDQKFVVEAEVIKNETKTPKRITTQYQTTGIFKDIGKEIKETTEKDITG